MGRVELQGNNLLCILWCCVVVVLHDAISAVPIDMDGLSQEFQHPFAGTALGFVLSVCQVDCYLERDNEHSTGSGFVDG